MSERDIIYRGKIIEVAVEQAAMPDGARATLEIVRHPGGAAVVALDERGRVCVLRQYRHAAGGWIWELPAGKLDLGEAPLNTAQRELAEEAGVAARDWVSLGYMLSSPGVFTEVVHLYAARCLTQGAPQTGQHEYIEVHWLDFAEALSRAIRGDIVDAKTVIGLFRAQSIAK